MSDLDLAVFLRERLDEDERIARDADGISRDAALDLYEDLIKSRPLDDQRRVYGIFITHFTSGRALWDIAAKRRILNEHRPGHPGPGGHPGCAVCDVGARSCGCMGSGHYPCLTVRLLALPYASHPEYRKEWRP